jgi:hypothetical protein
MSLIGYISLKYDKYWLNKILIKRKKKAKKWLERNSNHLIFLLLKVKVL